jgi:hypothetical protein
MAFLSRSAASAWLVAAIAWPSARGQTLTPHPPTESRQSKAPLAYTKDGVPRLMDMTPRRPARDSWLLQPSISSDWGKTWSTARPDGTPLMAIPAIAPGRSTEGITAVDWGDGSFLRVSEANTRYGTSLPPGTILYSTRENTVAPGREIDYRILVFVSKDEGVSWSQLPPVATSGKRATQADAKDVFVGLWSNFLFERSDGTIQVYYDTEEAAWDHSSPREQWLALKELLPGASPAWDTERIIGGNRPGHSFSRAGMPSVSEGVVGGVPTLFLTAEDVETYPDGPNRSSQGVVRVSRTTASDRGRGHTWEEVAKFSSPGHFNYLAPYHIRSKVTGELYLVFRSDARRATDSPQYRPAYNLKQAGMTGNASWVLGHIYAHTDGGSNGATWKPVMCPPGKPYMPGDFKFSFDPGISEIQVSPTKSELIFQWGEHVKGYTSRRADIAVKTWVQRVTLEK